MTNIKPYTTDELATKVKELIDMPADEFARFVKFTMLNNRALEIFNSITNDNANDF